MSRRDIIIHGLLWLLVVVVVLWADSSAKEHRANQPITMLKITVAENGGDSLVDTEVIESWLSENDIHPAGHTMAEVNLGRLESVIAEHSAVASVNAYMTYGGELYINITQRRAIARLRVEGYDVYVADDGYIMPVADGFLLSLPVITGECELLFDADYVGYHGDSSEPLLSDIEHRMDAIEERRVALLEERNTINAELRSIEKEGVKREIFMSDNEYRGRVESLKERKASARREHAAEDREIELGLRALETEKLAASLDADNVRRAVSDFDRLIGLVEYICDDPFWRAEVVQIVLSGGGVTPMQIEIVPRSGDFIVDMGFAENLVEKLSTLRTFYDSTLSNVGWDKYKHISLRYKNQVVCRER